MKWVVALLALLLPALSLACNEAVCGSIVSKCTLLKSCECEIPTLVGEPCQCCERCRMCLEHLLTECCSCVGLCAETRNLTSVVGADSAVYDFSNPTPSLWESLTRVEDPRSRWDAFTFPVDLPPSLVHRPKSSLESQPENLLLDSTTSEAFVTVNCTVAYMNQCTGKNKCWNNCQSMGASHARWFDDGCCECIGHNCRDYGINESRCRGCNGDEAANEEEEDEDSLEEMSDEELEQEERRLMSELYDDDE